MNVTNAPKLNATIANMVLQSKSTTPTVIEHDIIGNYFPTYSLLVYLLHTRIGWALASSYVNVQIVLSLEHDFSWYCYTGERGGSVVECRTPEREVRGSRPTAAVLCPWARHFTPRKYCLITQEAMAPSRYDWKIVDWDVKPQHNQPILLHMNLNTSSKMIFKNCLQVGVC